MLHLGSLRRALNKPVRVVARRAWQEVLGELEGFTPLSRPEQRRTRTWLLRETESPSVDALWQRLATASYPWLDRAEPTDCDSICTGGHDRILEAGERALRNEVRLLGSDLICLGERVDWHKDYKSGHRWTPVFHRRIDYHDFGHPTDVKFPWEVSRFHWVLPLAQAYRLAPEEIFADHARMLIDDWIEQNPYGKGVNWACAMEVALRLAAWTYLFHAFRRARSWADEGFRLRFLHSLFVQARFIERNLEESDYNSNHFLADALGLVFGGLFFGGGKVATRWSTLGWSILTREAERQVLSDGVDYEGSIAYHRLVMELLLYPALYRRVRGLEVPRGYIDCLTRMARFVAAYSRSDGTSPLVGDADDGRALPLGGQGLLDHRYLVGLMCATWHDPALSQHVDGPLDETFWLFGPDACRRFRSRTHKVRPISAAFRSAGFFVMRDDANHVFIDCGPVGLAGRGGHGHNDCLSFEATLAGTRLITDSGTLTYTGAYKERNYFRSTAAHNTPCIDHREINRFNGPRMLWSMRDDARPTLIHWKPGADRDVFRGSHAGYERLRQPVRITRTIVLDHASGALAVEDLISGDGEHWIEIPLHFAEGVDVALHGDRRAAVLCSEKIFHLSWEGGPGWTAQVHPARVSLSYGVARPTQCVRWTARTSAPTAFRFCIASDATDVLRSRRWHEWFEPCPQ